eukprot:4311921-Pleurochrysis_carterae.AAC.2
MDEDSSAPQLSVLGDEVDAGAIASGACSPVHGLHSALRGMCPVSQFRNAPASLAHRKASVAAV